MRHFLRISSHVTFVLLAALLVASVSTRLPLLSGAGVDVLRGASAFSDYRSEKPGTIRQIMAADLPRP